LLVDRFKIREQFGPAGLNLIELGIEHIKDTRWTLNPHLSNIVAVDRDVLQNAHEFSSDLFSGSLGNLPRIETLAAACRLLSERHGTTYAAQYRWGAY